MNFNRHSDLVGKHATLSASQWRWLNDDEVGLIKRLCGQYATDIGTILHNVAYKYIKFRTKMTRQDKKSVILELLAKGVPSLVVDNIDFDRMFETLTAYVNDGIGFKMTPEVVLYYSPNCFGTADAIAYSERDRFLRVHDYKSGVTPAHMEQLMIYAALFCLEYKVSPFDIESELRIYQSNDILCHRPEGEDISAVIDTIVNHDIFLSKVKGGV